MRKPVFHGSTALCSTALLGAILGLAGCGGDGLNIPNTNNPDVARAYATPAGVEGIVAGLGVQLNNPQRATESANTQAKILAGESYASVANFGMAVRAQIPRSAISNELGNDNQVGNLANFNSFQRVARSASNAIAAIDRLLAAQAATGSPSLGAPAQNARAKAFAFYILGQALGNVALAYDSASILNPTIPADVIPPLSGAKDVAKAALDMLDSAIKITNSPDATNGSGGWPLPATWINGQSGIDRAQFVRLARSFKARIRAGVARTKAERDAVDWPAVIADATNGITADFTVNIGSGSGWTAQFDVNQIHVVGGWHAVPYYYYGMADVSGGYDAWLATPRDSRKAFLVVSPDLRWPQGATRAAQMADTPANTLPALRYIRNRPAGDDVVLTGPGDSWYDHRRYGAVNTASNSGPYVDMSVTEVDMLAAEGYIRTGNITAAQTLINKTRVKNGLSAINVTSATEPISTNLATCVPRVPAAPNFTSTVCGNIFEAMKYEKRMETAFTGYMVWFADNRGWGDLVQGTAVEWPVPYQEMQARGTSYGNGNNRAPIGTYGF